MQTDNDNDVRFRIPPDAFRTDYRAQQMMVAVKELLDCPAEEFTPLILLEAELATSALLAFLEQFRDKR